MQVARDGCRRRFELDADALCAGGRRADEVAASAPGLEHAPTVEPERAERSPDGTGIARVCVVGVDGAAPGRVDLGRSQESTQL